MFAGIKLTSPDKVLYPDVGVTKLDLASYYEAIAPLHLALCGQPPDQPRPLPGGN